MEPKNTWNEFDNWAPVKFIGKRLRELKNWFYPKIPWGTIDRWDAGREGERLAARHLKSMGYRVLTKNYRSRQGEIDIIAMDGKILAFVEENGAKSVVLSDGIIGCPHEEGKDYPEGETCPECPYWANRDRWTGELIQ